MNVDELASRAGRDLRGSMHTDVETALDGLRELARRRRRAHATLAVVAVVTVVLLAVGVAQQFGPGLDRSEPPVVKPTRAQSPSVASPDVRGVGCRSMRVTCEGDRRYTVFLDAQFEWTIPPSFAAPYSGSRPSRELVATTTHDGTAGVAVLQHVRAAALQASPRIDPSVRTAEGFVRWVAARPFLRSSEVRATTLGGLRAWTVEVEVAPGASKGPATCAITRAVCYPLMVVPHGPTKRVFGLWDGLVSRYTAVEMTDAGITVLWSWSTGPELPSEADELAASIRFG
jgi:hypothetical protein